MKGLLVKDLALMKQRGKILIFLVLWGIVMRAVMDDSSFVVGWIVMIATITSVSTISYDEYDNCMPFLMSMPVTRRGYAAEKYLFTLITGAVFWAVSVLIAAVGDLVMKKAFSPAEELPGMMIFLAVVLLIASFTIPPQLKWGAEKGRIVMLILFGVIFVGAFAVSRIEAAREALANLSRLSLPAVFAGVIGGSIALAAISLLISFRIMEQKEL